MLMAVFGDLAGNFSALKRVLSALEEEGIQTIIHTGNSVSGADDAVELLDTLQENNIISVQGERDRQIALYQQKQKTIAKRVDENTLKNIEAAHSALRSGQREALGGLKRFRRITVDEIDIVISHGLPANRNNFLDVEISEDKLRRQREREAGDLFLFGGGDTACIRKVDGFLFVNPGPLVVAPDKAQYALVNTETAPWKAHLEQVNF